MTTLCNTSKVLLHAIFNGVLWFIVVLICCGIISAVLFIGEKCTLLTLQTLQKWEINDMVEIVRSKMTSAVALFAFIVLICKQMEMFPKRPIRKRWG